MKRTRLFLILALALILSMLLASCQLVTPKSIVSIEKTGSEGNVDTYTIYYSDGDEFSFTITNGLDGKDGADGKVGADGKDGINGTNGTDGKNGKDGTDGKDGKDGKDGINGTDGKTPTFKLEGNTLYVSYDDGASWEKLGELSSGGSNEGTGDGNTGDGGNTGDDNTGDDGNTGDDNTGDGGNTGDDNTGDGGNTGDDNTGDGSEEVDDTVTITASDITSGGWSHGSTTSKKSRLRSIELIPVKAGSVITYDPKGMELYFYFVEGAGATSSIEVSNWLSSAGTYTVKQDCYLGLVAAAAGRAENLTVDDYVASVVIDPTPSTEVSLQKRNVYRFGGEGNDWCFVYLPEGYDPDRSEPYPFVICNHGNGWTMNGSAEKANWTDITMYMSSSAANFDSSRMIATEDESLWYSNPTIEALLAEGYIVCGAQNYGDALYGNVNCRDACVDFYYHMQEKYNVTETCSMIGASNGAMTTLNAVSVLGEKVSSIVLQYPLTCLVNQYYENTGHQAGIRAAYGITDTTDIDNKLLEATQGFDPLTTNVEGGKKQGYFPATLIYYSDTDTTTKASANALPLYELLFASDKEVKKVKVDTDGNSHPHGDKLHFDPEGYVNWIKGVRS